MSDTILKRFPNAEKRPRVIKGEGCYLFLENGKRLLDASSGWCAQNVLGYSHPDVLAALRKQMETFCHLDINHWENDTIHELADLLLSQAPPAMSKVYFCGTSGSEAVEAAMKLSYQEHYNNGKKEKTFFISRDESFHGATLQAMALSNIDIFKFYEPLMPADFAKIPVHYPLRGMRQDESIEQYGLRSAKQLENKILEIGPNRVAAFVGETMLGGLLGDVPPAPNYWKEIRRICDQYDVHLILDEVYCGLGRSGKIFCYQWDEVVPDFVCVAKALGGGYAPLSAVITQKKTEDAIRKNQARIHGGHTYQGYALGCAAGLAIQKIVHRPETLNHILNLGERMRASLESGLKEHPFYREVRGRGLQFALEFQTPNNVEFSSHLYQKLEEDYEIVVSCKWHRVSFAIPFIMNFNQADMVTESVIEAFKKTARTWM